MAPDDTAECNHTEPVAGAPVQTSALPLQTDFYLKNNDGKINLFLNCGSVGFARGVSGAPAEAAAPVRERAPMEKTNCKIDGTDNRGTLCVASACGS